MRVFFGFFITLNFSLIVSGFAMAHGLSPVRHAEESFENARLRQYLYQDFSQSVPQQGISADSVSRYVSAEAARKPLIELDLSLIPDVRSYEALEKEFRYIRDTKFLKGTDPAFPRRLTWLFPDDGCYARAELAKNQLILNKFFAPKKIFVFGNLYAQSPNTPSGSVTWWYHVAVTYRVGEEAFVFDPSIEPSRPLTLAEWNEEVGGNQTLVKYSICSADTFDPRSDCVQPKAIFPAQAVSEQNGFLQPEWNRLLYLNRDPQRELGDFPPWMIP